MLIVDRLEGEYAVCENSDTLEYKKLPKVMLPRGVQEGDCIIIEKGVYKIDGVLTLQRRKMIQSKLNDLYN